MSAELATMMFDILQKRIGSEVSCKTWKYGEEVSYRGILTEVIPFDRITLNNNIIPFVGDVEAIEEITLDDGKIVYTNPRVAGYTAKDMMALAQAQQDMLGHSVKMDEMQGRAK